MCTGRIDLSFPIRAFLNGADGVFMGGCWPGECHYITEGNYDALGNSLLSKKLLSHVELDPNRLRLDWIAASEGSRFAEVMSEFVGQVKALGPLGSSEELDEAALARKLDAVQKVVPYLRLVERERLRAHEKSEQAYHDYYGSDEVDRLFEEVIADKLAVSQILSLLGDQPLSTAQIAEALALNPSEVSRHMNSSSRHGFVKFDVASKCFALA